MKKYTFDELKEWFHRAAAIRAATGLPASKFPPPGRKEPDLKLLDDDYKKKAVPNRVAPIKLWAEIPASDRSKYKPHQGKQEMVRRVRQMVKSPRFVA